MKQGVVKNFFNSKISEEKEEYQALDTEIFVSDEALKKYVDDIFAKEYKNISYHILGS